MCRDIKLGEFMNTTFCWRLLYKRNYKVMALTIFFTGMTFPYWVLYFKTNMFALKTTRNEKIEYPFILCNFLISLIDFVEKTAFTICCVLWFKTPFHWMKHKATVIFLSAESHNRDIARLERVGHIPGWSEASVFFSLLLWLLHKLWKIFLLLCQGA